MEKQPRINYYDIVVCCARKVNQKDISWNRLVKVLELLSTKLGVSLIIDMEQLRLAWKEFRKA